MKWVLLLCCSVLGWAETLAQIEARARQAKAKGDAAAALAAYEEAAKLNPKSAVFQDEIGFLLAVQQRGPEAISKFQAALALQPDYAPARYHLGVALCLAGDFDRALPELKRAAELMPKEFDYQFRAGDALYQAGQYSEAAAYLKAASALRENDPKTWNQLGLALEKSRDT